MLTYPQLTPSPCPPAYRAVEGYLGVKYMRDISRETKNEANKEAD
jgi:hypothetical protein